MSAPTGSYAKVFYDVRPAKQIERRMIIDALHRLQEASFRIRNYQYTGFGSIYFVDFVLLHRLLGMDKLLSVEYDRSISKRIEFNRPFIPVETRMAPIGDVIPTLSRDHRHLLWLDYDDRLNEDMIQDMSLASSVLPTGSLVLVTVDVEPMTDSAQAEYEWYSERASRWFDRAWGPRDFTRSSLSASAAKLLGRVVTAGVAGRQGIDFTPLFCFEYADGHRMITIGGMLTSDSERAQLAGATLAELPFVRASFDEPPFRIAVPRLTRKERVYLDQHMPCVDGWVPTEFELKAGSVTEYREVYRYYPMYAELLF